MPQILLAAALFFTSCAVHAASFKIATVAPDGSTWMQEMRAAAETVSGRTEGRVTFRFYPGGVMGNEKNVLRKIRIGQLQGGALTAGGLALIRTSAQIYGLPFLFRSYEEVDYVRSRMDAEIMQGLEENGFVSLGLVETGFAYLMSQRPMRTAADLDGDKVWIPAGDEISRQAFGAIGVSPIPLPLTDVLTGLQTGLIDTVASSPVGAIALQWHTRVRSLTLTPLSYLYGSLVIDRGSFEKLSEQDRAVVREVFGQASANLSRQSRADNQSARAALEAQGIAMIQPSAAEVKEWQEAVAPTNDRMARDGLYPLELLDQARTLLADFHNGGVQ